MLIYAKYDYVNSDGEIENETNELASLIKHPKHWTFFWTKLDMFNQRKLWNSVSDDSRKYLTEALPLIELMMLA